MLRNPGHSAAIVATIALGAGLNGALVLVFNAAFLRPPDVSPPEEVVRRRARPSLIALRTE